MDQSSQVLIHSLSPVLLISLSCISFLFFSALLKYFVIISRHHKLFHRCHFITFRILYIMFNFVWTFIYKIYDVSVWSTNHVELLWDFSNWSVNILLVFELFLYIIFIVWHYESYHLYCVVRAVYIGLGSVLFFTMPCHVHVHMTEEHIVSLRYTSSFCLRYPGSIKTHSRYISDRVKSISSHYYSHQSVHVRHYFLINLDPF